MALIRCILDKFLGVVCHCFPPRLDVPTFAARCLHVLNDVNIYIYIILDKIIHCSWLLKFWWVVYEKTWCIWGLELRLYIGTSHMQVVHNFD
jgi:hypothetical protein